MAATTKASKEVTIDRRRNDGRRQEDTTEGTTQEDTEATSEATEETSDSPVRRKVQRRRQIDPTTCERDYTKDEIEFMQALDDYKRRSGRMFPTCSEVLEVVRDLGYMRLFDAVGNPLHPVAEAFMVDVDETDEEVEAEAASEDDCLTTAE